MIEGHRPRPVVLCVLDGWGHRDDPHNNAILAAGTPVWDGLIASCPNALLDASARQVGLPGGQMGNSEAGHMNLGAGRVVYQDLLRIDAALADGSLAANPALGDFIARLKASGGIAQLMGLVSPGGVHAHKNHIQGLAKLLGQAGLQVAIHAFLDGRDTPPRSAGEYLAKLIDDIRHDLLGSGLEVLNIDDGDPEHFRPLEEILLNAKDLLEILHISLGSPCAASMCPRDQMAMQ